MSSNIREKYVNPTSHAGLKKPRVGNCYPSIKANEVKKKKEEEEDEECRRNYMKLLIKQVCGLSCVTALRFEEKSAKYDFWCSERHKWNTIQPHYTGEKTDISPSRPQHLTAKQSGSFQNRDTHPHLL